MRDIPSLVTKFNPPDTTYPDGSAKNDAVPGDNSGTELVESWVNETLQPFLKAIRQVGETPDGNPETGIFSQALNAILQLGSGKALVANWYTVASVGSTLWDVCYAAELDLFCACGSNRNLYTSPDGVTWTLQTTGVPPGTDTLYGIAWNGIRFIAAGHNGVTGVVLTSVDGITWSIPGTPSNGLYYDVQDFGTTGFYLVGGNDLIEYSFGPGTLPWVVDPPPTSGETYFGIGIDGGTAVIVGTNETVISGAFGAWTLDRNIPAGNTFWDVSRGRNKWVICGIAGIIAYATIPAGPWTLITPLGSSFLAESVFYGFNDVYVVTGSGGLLATSEDGINWHTRHTGLAPADTINSIVLGTESNPGLSAPIPSKKNKIYVGVTVTGLFINSLRTY